MEGFLFIYNKKRRQNYNSHIIKSKINDIKETNHNFHIRQNNKITAVYYTNEHDLYPYEEKDDFLFCPVGQFTVDKNEIQRKLLKRNAQLTNDTISGLLGTFLIGTSDFTLNKIDVFTHIVRAECAYSFESDECIVLGTDPVVVSIFSNQKLTPVLSPGNFTSFIESGFFSDEQTPFDNVESLPANAHISVFDNRIHIADIDNTYRDAFTMAADKKTFERFTETFLAGFNIVDNKVDIKSALTGGKDSRLVLFALLENQFNVKTFTNGFIEHPDVYIAKNIADYYGLDHEVNNISLNEANEIEIDLEKRLISSMVATSGQIFAYENISSPKKFRKANTFNGIGGEIIRGGYNITADLDADIKAEKIAKQFYKHPELFLNKKNKYSDFLEKYIQLDEDYKKLLYLQFLLYRTGRWSSGARLAKNYNSDMNSPFLDNQLIKLTLKMDINTLYSEIIPFKILENIDRNATRFPYYRNRFKFENEQPLHPNDYSDWLLRAPEYAKTEIGSYNWRNLGNNQEKMIREFRNIVLSDRNNLVFDIVDYKMVEELMYRPIKDKDNKILWSIASMICYTDYIKNKEKRNGIIKLEIPGNKINTVSVPFELMDLTPFYKSINKSLNVKENLNKKEITVVDNKKNLYIKTFEGKFNEVPSEKSIENVEKLIIKSNFDVYDSETKVSMYIMLYDEKERIVKHQIQGETEGDFIVCNGSIEVPKNAKHFRVACAFRADEGTRIMLNYSFAKLKFKKG